MSQTRGTRTVLGEVRLRASLSHVCRWMYVLRLQGRQTLLQPMVATTW